MNCQGLCSFFGLPLVYNLYIGREIVGTKVYHNGRGSMRKGRRGTRIAGIIFIIFGFIFINPGGPRLVTIFSSEGKLEVLTARVLVKDILDQANLTLSTGERVFPSANEPALGRIDIVRGNEISLTADGQEMTVFSWAETVGEFMVEQGYSVDNYLSNWPKDQALAAGMMVKLIRVEIERVSEVIALAAETIYKDEPALDQGQETIKTKAREGSKLVTYEVTCHDGEEVKRKLVHETVLVSPVTGVILRGVPRVSRGRAAIEGLASYYGSGFHGRKTASGVPYDMYAFTAAHRSLPFGTMVKVTYLATGKSVVVKINDRGPFIAGRIIDLSTAAAKAIGLDRVGVGRVKVEVIN